VQVGSFKLKPSPRYIAKLRSMGLPYEIKKSNIYKIMVGPYKKESTARKALKKVRQKINKSAFLTKL
jgi:cell division septation protein DedD